MWLDQAGIGLVAIRQSWIRYALTFGVAQAICFDCGGIKTRQRLPSRSGANVAGCRLDQEAGSALIF